MDPTYIAMIIFYWLFLTGVVFVSGAFAARIIVTGPTGAEVFIPAGKKRCLGESAARFIFLVALLTFFMDAGHFILHCSVMTETPLNEVFSILPAFLIKTKYGKFTLLKSFFLLVTILISLAAIKRDKKFLAVSGTISSVFILVVISMSGHQGAEGYVTIPFYLDLLHIITISLWIGGIFFLCFCFSFLLREKDGVLWGVFKAIINRFSLLATYCVFIAGISGIVLSFLNVKGLSVLLHTQYGVILLLKLLLVGIMVMLGGMNKFYLIPRMNHVDRENQLGSIQIRKELTRNVRFEAYLGIAISLLTSLLTHISPES